jgi:mannosyltransferase
MKISTLFGSARSSSPSAPVVAPTFAEHRDPTTAPPRERWAPSAEWGVPFAVALLVGLWRLGVPALHVDEVAGWSAATRSFSQLLELVKHQDTVIFPYHAFMQLWTSVGDSEWWLRLPSVLAVALAAALTAVLGRHLGLNGLIAGLVFALFPATSHYAQYARVYALTILLAVAATLALVRALDAPKASRWAAYVACVLGLGLSHLIALLLLPVHAVYSVWRHGRLTVAWALAFLLPVVALIPFVIISHGTVPAFGRPTTVGMLIDGGVKLAHGRTGLIFTALVISAIGLALLWPGLRDVRRAALPLLWCTLPPVVLLVTTAWFPLWQSRYLAFTLPGWALLSAWAIARVPRRPAVIIAVGLAVLTIFPQWQQRQFDSRGDPRTVAAIIADQAQPGDAIVYGTHHASRNSMDFYLPRDGRPSDVLVRASAASVGSFAAQECSLPSNCLGEAPRLWVVEVFPETEPLEPAKVRAVADSYRWVDQWDSLDWRLRLFELDR